jgi:hypothetical protein
MTVYKLVHAVKQRIGVTFEGVILALIEHHY